MPGEQHYNPIGTVHAGIAATLLDSAMACAVHSSIPLGKVVHGGKSTATAEGRLEDASGALYAHATTTCIILG